MCWHDPFMEQANKELVRAYTKAVFDEGDVSAVDRYLASDLLNHVTGRSGTADFRRLAAELGGAPEAANVIDFLVAEGDFVVAFMTITRTVPSIRGSSATRSRGEASHSPFITSTSTG